MQQGGKKKRRIQAAQQHQQQQGQEEQVEEQLNTGAVAAAAAAAVAAGSDGVGVSLSRDACESLQWIKGMLWTMSMYFAGEGAGNTISYISFACGSTVRIERGIGDIQLCFRHGFALETAPLVLATPSSDDTPPVCVLQTLLVFCGMPMVRLVPVSHWL